MSARENLSTRAPPGRRQRSEGREALSIELAALSGKIDRTMFDIQHDSAVPIHEQLTSQIRVHIASDALRAGAVLKEYRAFAQELLTNPQVVARAYAELETEGVLTKGAAGAMVVSPAARIICRTRLYELARERICQAVALGLACGLSDADIAKAVERGMTDGATQPLSPDQILQEMKKPKHEHGYRASEGIQVLPRNQGAGPT